jgi:hypothetical protein
VIRKEDAAGEGGSTMVGVLRGLDVVGLFENEIMNLRYGTGQELTEERFGHALWLWHRLQLIERPWQESGVTA